MTVSQAPNGDTMVQLVAFKLYFTDSHCSPGVQHVGLGRPSSLGVHVVIHLNCIDLYHGPGHGIYMYGRTHALARNYRTRYHTSATAL